MHTTFSHCHQQKVVQSKTLWVLSNIAAVPECNEKLVHEEPHVWENVLRLSKHPSWNMRGEACWALSNLILYGSDATVVALASKHDTIRNLCGYLKRAPDHKLTIKVLEAIGRVLCCARVERKVEFVLKEFVYSKGPERLEHLYQKSDCQEVSALADSILETHEAAMATDNDDGEDQNVLPPIALNQQAFILKVSKQLVDGTRIPLPSGPLSVGMLDNVSNMKI